MALDCNLYFKGGITMEKGFTEDPRYRIATKEALLTIFLFILNFLWWFFFAYGLGSRPPEEYTYILGFPAWFFWSVIVGFILFSVLVYLMVRFLFTDLPLEARPEKESRQR